MSDAITISELLAGGADTAVAIAAPERRPLTYRELRALLEQTVSALNRLGIGRNDRVAIVLPNGPEMATAFVSIAAGATTAPLNPVYRAEEFEFYLSDLNAKALVIMQGNDSPAPAVAEKLGIPVLKITSAADAPAGFFEFAASDHPISAAATAGPARADDIALVLHTSGTTSRPKIVPLSQRNVCASARNIRRTLALEPADRCMNIMPLFHIHGLIAAVLSSLGAGGSVYCTPGFNALKVLAWMTDARPTWYSAVPTMHQAILARAGRNADTIADIPLRFIRSSSSSLPPQVMEELEQTFAVPVLESMA